MGGNAFDTAARRLSQEDHDALTTLMITRLSPLFKGIAVPRYVAAKKSHGDIDILCGYESEILVGEEEFDPEIDGEGAKVKPLKNSKAVTGEWVGEIRQFIAKLMEVMEAKAWRRRGSDINFRIPCTILEKQVAEEHEFYQVDLVLTPPQNLAFVTFMTSYSSTSILLGRILRYYSHSLTIHLTHFVFRHTAYFGIQPIDITLTDDPEVFCSWFGTDYQKWLIQGKDWKFDWQFWQWLTDVPDESPAGTAFRRLARKIQRDGDKAVKKARGKRDTFADKFYVWFMTRSKWAPTEEDENASMPDEEKERNELPPKPTPAELSMINIDKPFPMDKGAEEVLDFWGKRAEYDALFEQRKIMATPIAESQRLKMEKKMRTKALLDAQEEMIKKNFGELSIK
ncbi:hypothetical protein AYX14_04022 [Cryptococcus neoformans]|nr:hypothetical protein AYX14_04022 [Cryptococcus neoformans var. grubii]